ncbi:MAG: hypothetical protein D6771_05955, partial [Zetaproteobacteria bacterium]
MVALAPTPPPPELPPAVYVRLVASPPPKPAPRAAPPQPKPPSEAKRRPPSPKPRAALKRPRRAHPSAEELFTPLAETLAEPEAATDSPAIAEAEVD